QVISLCTDGDTIKICPPPILHTLWNITFCNDGPTIRAKMRLMEKPSSAMGLSTPPTVQYASRSHPSTTRPPFINIGASPLSNGLWERITRSSLLITFGHGLTVAGFFPT